jgi:hypothetical protein
MAKPTITKRSTKGAALTYTELDNNFDNLKDATITLTAGTAGTAVTTDLNGNITLVAGTGITLAGNNTSKTITITASGGSSSNAFATIAVAGQSNVEADSTTDTLTLVAGTGITLTTNATSDTVTITNSVGSGWVGTAASDLNMSGFAIKDSTQNYVYINEQYLWIGNTSNDTSVITTTYNNGLSLRTSYPGVDPSSTITINDSINNDSAIILAVASSTNGDIKLTPDGTGKVKISSNIELGTGGAVIAYDSGASKITFDKAIQTSNLKITTNEIQAMNSNGNIKLTPDGTGKIQLGSLYFPTSDGTANQVLKTDGSGNLGWTTVSGGSSVSVGIFRPTIPTTSNWSSSAANFDVAWEELQAVSGVSVSTSTLLQFTAGTYLIEFTPNFNIGSGGDEDYQIGLYNNTDAAYINYNQSGALAVANGFRMWSSIATRSLPILTAYWAPTGTKTLAIRGLYANGTQSSPYYNYRGVSWLKVTKLA